MTTNHDHEEHHILEYGTGIAVFGGLIFLTVITVLTAKYVDLGWFNFPLAMIIATIKAGLVCAWFMGLKFDSIDNRIIFFGGLIF